MLPAYLVSILAVPLMLLLQAAGSGGALPVPAVPPPPTDLGPMIDGMLKLLSSSPAGALAAFLTVALPFVGELLKKPQFGELMKKIPPERRWILLAGVSVVFAVGISVQTGVTGIRIVKYALVILLSGTGLYHIVWDAWLGKTTGAPKIPVLVSVLGVSPPIASAPPEEPPPQAGPTA